MSRDVCAYRMMCMHIGVHAKGVCVMVVGCIYA